ncbi:hypothetical protein EYC84_005639 [Monilinia fructicola]|uniref:Uncharacterized protein n=1 Tax=Monilinia fructicola TaxID=38448 RepID=A0A5M9JZN5_MONFR|nr:hypothetical protein EYC84_005639 [Monilinia fructicola]
MTNPPQSNSDSSSDDDGAPIYTPPETEHNDGPSSSTHSLDPSHLNEVIQGIQNVRLAKDESDDSAQKSIKDNSAKRKGRGSTANKSIPADIAVDNVTDTLQILVVADGGTDNLEQERKKSKSAKNRKERERKKRRKARLAEEKAKNETDAEISNGKSKYKTLKDAGYRNGKHFMDSHGLRLHDDQDIATANEMIERLKQDQASEKQSKQMHVSNKGEAKRVDKVEDSSVKLTTGKTKKKNVVSLWEDYFGNETQLANWQKLCVDVGMEEIPTSITQCRKALGKVWVNIFDFLDAKANGKPVKRYKSEQKLATYTMNSGKIYPKKQAKQGGPARVLLAHIFRH